MTKTPMQAREENMPRETRRSMVTWSQRIETYAAVPSPFKSACQSLLANIQPFPYVVFAPAMSGFKRKTTEKMMAEVAGAFYIWERRGSQIAASVFPIQTISTVEVGHILLYSWLTLRGVDVAGEAAAATVEFNTVSTPHFTPFVAKVRPSLPNVQEAEWRAQQAKFDFLAAANYKFMNYARESVLPGAEVLHTIWQPRVRQPLITLFGWSFYRTLFLAHLTVLTDQELIFIGDDPRLTAVRGERHGGIWQYVPLRHIQAASLTAESRDVLTLSLALYPGSHRLEKRFAAAQEPELSQFQRHLERLMGAAAGV